MAFLKIHGAKASDDPIVVSGGGTGIGAKDPTMGDF